MRALFIDFYGTISDDRLWNGLPAEQRKKLRQVLFGRSRPLFNEWLRGRYTAEDVNNLVAEHLQIPYKEVWNIFIDDCQSMIVPSKILSLLDDLREDRILVLVTGNTDAFSRFIEPALNLEKYFDHISNSYYEGKHKGDDGGSLFLELAERLNVSLSDSILVDDQKKYCDLFEQHGGISHQTKSLDDTAEILTSFL